MMKLEDEGHDPGMGLNAEVERVFKQHYLAGLNGPPFIRLENMQKHGQKCAGLIEQTANALSDGVVALMLVAVQRDNLELGINQAIRWTHQEFGQCKGSPVIKKIIRWIHSDFGQGNESTEAVIKTCMVAFPTLWYWVNLSFFISYIVISHPFLSMSQLVPPSLWSPGIERKRSDGPLLHHLLSMS